MVSVTYLSAAERETSITTTDDSDVVRIWTARPRHIGQLKRHPKFTLVAEGMHGTTAWAEFEIADAGWSPATGAKRKRELTDEQRQELRERFAKVRTG